MTEPSAGYANEPPTPTASGGAETEGVAPPGWPGTATWTANARAAVRSVVERVAEAEPPDNATTAASASAAETRRPTPPIMGIPSDVLFLCSVTPLKVRIIFR